MTSIISSLFQNDYNPVLKINNISKSFNHTVIFKEIDIFLKSGEVLGVFGTNGSGKTTLLKIISGLTKPSNGSVEYLIKGSPLDAESLRKYIGLCAPFISFYRDFSALENVKYLCQLRGTPWNKDYQIELFNHFGLGKCFNRLCGEYSSGMIQRLRLICAVTHDPAILLLDEPMSYLDENGRLLVEEIIVKHRTKGLTVVATNQECELALVDRTLKLVS